MQGIDTLDEALRGRYSPDISKMRIRHEDDFFSVPVVLARDWYRILSHLGTQRRKNTNNIGNDDNTDKS